MTATGSAMTRHPFSPSKSALPLPVAQHVTASMPAQGPAAHTEVAAAVVQS